MAAELTLRVNVGGGVDRAGVDSPEVARVLAGRGDVAASEAYAATFAAGPIARPDRNADGSVAFYVGVHHPYMAARFRFSMLSVNVLAPSYRPGYIRKAPVAPGRRWMLDSGAFTLLTRPDWRARRAGYVEWYADVVRTLAERNPGQIACATAADWMCEDVATRRTGDSVLGHIFATVNSHIRLVEALGPDSPVPVLPVLQGRTPDDYLRCLYDYGNNITPRNYRGPSSGWTFGLPGERYIPRGSWLGVGSVCKRNGSPAEVLEVLRAVKAVRPDVHLHGFGLKLTALADPRVRELLASSDSMAWSKHARSHGRDGNDPREAEHYVRRVEAVCRGEADPGECPPPARVAA